jgi:hypothetical protein
MGFPFNDILENCQNMTFLSIDTKAWIHFSYNSVIPSSAQWVMLYIYIVAFNPAARPKAHAIPNQVASTTVELLVNKFLCFFGYYRSYTMTRALTLSPI